ncbi:uncharacterized protein [Magallana gigas]|uniref:uncharacterized protein isoform X2 n=1 Tax=Magallana gigas TaxID=29159 RepID=UPI0033413123
MPSKFVEFSIYGKLYFLWILCFVKLSKGTSITLTCPEGWVLSGTMCYRLYGQDTLTSSTWDNAYRVCKGNGAEMVTVDDFFTNQNVGDFASAQNTNKFWTGMSVKGVITQNGVAMTWNMNVAASIYQGQWSVKNPDKAHGDCVYIEKEDGEYVWTINSCLMKMAFVCQRTPCLPQSFHCDNGRCVNSNWRCDGVDDCGDFSDEVECAGRCSFLLDTASSGRIQSPNHPSNYQPSRVCTWTIVGPEGSNIYLEFTSFDTEKDTDIVEVHIGGRTESTARSVARLSGQPSLSTARYRSYNNYMIIRFSTDSQTEKVGFTANYNSSRDSYPKELYMTARTTVSTLEPPLFSSHGSNAYLGNRDYVWIINAEERQKIVTLERMKIDLMGDDVIEIRDGDSGSTPLLEKYTASNNDDVDLPLSQSEPVIGKRFVFSTSNVMYVIMRTSGSTSGTGFSFQYRQGCVARYTADAGEITSPGYPNVNYANFQTCTWTIDISSGKGVKVMLDISKGFEIADNEDFIQVYTGTTDDSGIAAHGSGAGFTTISLSNDQPFHSPNGKMFIRFKSTAITNKKGFRLLYSVDCPDPGLTEASEVNRSQTAVQLRQFDNEFTVNCKNGYSFHSDELNLRTLRMKCMYGGKWLVEQRTRTIPQCKPNYCGEPVAVENGYISHSSGVVFGSFVTFTCFPGFSLLGSANITCQANQWTSRPQCVSANCPALPTISNGQLSSSGDQYAAIVNYTCNAGYQLIGAPILFCQSTGQWTASAPKCIKTTCPIPAIKNGRVSSSTLPKFQETLTVTCDVGYIVNGSATITCGDDRNFDAVPNCIDQNECDTTNGGCSQNCINTEGYFYCTCNAGYKLNADKRQCDDIDECTADSPKNGGCSQICTNSVGSYTCSCDQPGYVLFDVDGRSGYTIQSPDDGNKAGDVYHLGHSCVRRNCSEPAVVNNAMLMTKRAIHRYMDKITFMCDLGYVKSRGEETFTCGSDGQWTPSQTTNLLECSVATCPVSDLNTLNLNNRPTLSTTNPVSYLDYLNMTCDVPGKGTIVNQQQCLFDKKTNTYALYGASYECEVLDDCASNPCLYGGTCTDLVGGYSCTCPTGYQGTRCQNRVNPCSLNRCSNGQCVDAYSMDLFKCICQPGYQYGLICPYEMYNGNGTSLTPFSTLSGTTTIGNCRQQCDNLQICQAYTFAAGTCKLYQTAPTDPTITAAAGSTLNIKKCIYPDDDYWSPWYNQGPPNGGKEEEKRVQLLTYGVNVCNGTEPIDAECRVVGSKAPSSGTGDTFSLPCGVDGIECTDQVNNPCEDYEVRYKCAVYKGFQSNICSLKNHCLSNPCINGGLCSSSFNDFVCSCPTGYTGKLCQHDFDSCQTNPCLQGGTCKDKPGSQGYECQCPAGYGGSICQSNINECSSNPCDPVGSLWCRDAVNDYMCNCKPGYTGKNCSTEINECDAKPCMHGGNCTDQVNDFQCACPEGWTGKRCEMIYDECTVNNKCPSSSQCLNIFKKSYCKCPINTYGEVCEYSPDICSDLRPCLNSATCTAGVDAQSKCTCPNDDYRDNGCEIMVNHCGDPNKCENGGTCVNLAPGFRCDCPPGYSGANCSINVNDCSNNCPSTSTCIDMVNAHYCRCPLGKTGESCVRDLDTNYDLYFYLTSQDSYAALPYPIYLSGSSFSLSVWVRFYQSSLTGTFLTIFIAKSANSLAGVTKFLSLDHQGLVVYNQNGQNPQRAAYQQQTVTDGQWNFVVVSWNKDNGFDLVVNSLRQSQIPTTPYTSMMAQNIWVTLGADFDSTIMPKVNGGFRGYVSQLNIYNRGLSFENEMPQLIPDPRKVFSGSILRWNEFVYHRGVKPVYPSSAQKPCTGANCLAHNKKFPVFKTPCPSNVYKVSADRLTSVTWTEPIPQGATIQESSYKSGETFLWGKYTNMYVIRDEKNTSNFCSFNIYVMREQCPDPDPPHLGTRACERSYNPYFGCTIGCTDANRRIDRYTPNVYTCGPSGAWNPSNRNIPLRFPSCGLVQSQARRRVMMKLAYPNISAIFCDALALNLREAFTSVNTRWSSQICHQPDCSDMTVAVNCRANERRKRQTSLRPTSVTMIISTSMAILTRSSPAETLNVEEILIRSVLESQLLNFSTTIPNGSPELNSFTIDSSESCPTRQSVVDGYCVKCGPGNFFNSSTLVCEDCPVGTYQDQDDQTSCTPCPQGSTTQTVASPSSSDCKPICSPGHYQTGSRCDPCGVGFYQSQYGMFYCDPCPVNSTTRGDSSTSASLCDVSSSVTNEQSDRRKNETITVYYIIGFSCTGIIVILLVTVVCILVRRHLKLVKEMHSSHYVKTIDSSTLQQIDANYDTQYQELEESHYHYLTPCDANSQL